VTDPAAGDLQDFLISRTGSMPQYRLIDHRGAPHPVLDDLYDSLEAAWSDARSWWGQHLGRPEPAEQLEPMAIGIEVSTASGNWRTVRHPG
jgi:hypothetical protein